MKSQQSRKIASLQAEVKRLQDRLGRAVYERDIARVLNDRLVARAAEGIEASPELSRLLLAGERMAKAAGWIPESVHTVELRLAAKEWENAKHFQDCEG